MAQFKRGDVARMWGYLVDVVEVRHVAGGVAIDVKRHASQGTRHWPWSVDAFTTAAENLRELAPCVECAECGEADRVLYCGDCHNMECVCGGRALGAPAICAECTDEARERELDADPVSP